jgi:hypothetical protein
MIKKELATHYFFGIGPYKQRLRLVVFKNDEEFVCRKESIKNLKMFLADENNRLFKGSLQLIKIENKICVLVKNEITGTITKAGFQKLLA